MIDRESRDRLALALRRLAVGRITNDEFDDVWCELPRGDGADAALDELGVYGWLHYSDLRTYRLRGRHALSPHERRAIARCVLFLKTGQPYIHGDAIAAATCFGRGFVGGFLIVQALAVFTGLLTYLALGTFAFGCVGVLLPAYVLYMATWAAVRTYHRLFPQQRITPLEGTFWPFLNDKATMEAYRFWPFAGPGEYEAALARPPYLCGRSAWR